MLYRFIQITTVALLMVGCKHTTENELLIPFEEQDIKNEAMLPFDQHMLLAACAPRKLYVSSFPKKWFDPYGEFLSIKAAEPVWRFLGHPGLPTVNWPPENTPISSTHLGYHRRPGGHGIPTFDWQCYLNFTDQAFGLTPTD